MSPAELMGELLGSIDGATMVTVDGYGPALRLVSAWHGGTAVETAALSVDRGAATVIETGKWEDPELKEVRKHLEEVEGRMRDAARAQLEQLAATMERSTANG
jgi:hypothetical protein